MHAASVRAVSGVLHVSDAPMDGRACYINAEKSFAEHLKPQATNVTATALSLPVLFVILFEAAK